MPSLIEKVRRSTFYVLPAQAVTKILGMVYLVLLTRGLGVSDYGVYSFLAGLFIVFGYLCNFGLAEVSQRFLPEYAQRERYGHVIKTILFAHSFRAILSALVLAAAAVWFGEWAGRFGISGRKLDFIAFSAGAFFLYQIEYFQTEFNGLFMHKQTSIIQVIYTSLKLPVVLAVLVGGFGLVGVLAAEAAVYLFGSGMLLSVFVKRVYRVYSVHDGPRMQAAEIRRMARYMAFNAAVGPGAILYSNAMDYFVVAAMANTHELGLYALASRASLILRSLMPQNVLQSVIRPAFYQRYSAAIDRNSELNRMFRLLVNMVAAVLFPAVIISGLVAGAAFPAIFGDKYAAAVPPFLILLLFSLATILEFSSDMVLQAIEKVEAHLYGQVFALYNLAAAILLMPSFGIRGVAFATGSALLCKSLYFYYMAHRYTGVCVRWRSVGRIGVNAALAGMAVFEANLLGTGPLYVVIAVIAGVLVYLGLTVVNNFMGRDDKRLLNQFLKRHPADN